MTGSSDPIRLRAHHLLCVLTFAGHGYSDAFVANLRQIVERLRMGEPVTLVDGPDDICAPLCGASDSAHCYDASVTERDRLARAALMAVPELAPLFARQTIPWSPSRIAALRAHFTAGSIRSACVGCEWSSLCTKLASDGYAATVL